MIVFDTETTGLLRPDPCDINLQPHMIEIYLCKFDFTGKVIAEFETFVKPPIAIPEIITKITGIDDNSVKNAPTFIEIYDDLVEFCLGEKTIFAHNCAFDIGIIKSELRRHGLEYNFPWPPYQCCTVEASFPINNKRLKLEQLYELATGKTEIKNKHRAKGDVIALKDSICWLKKEGFIHDFFN